MTAPATQPAARERPILFKGRLVRAILEGRKTQTRRALGNQSKLIEICASVPNCLQSIIDRCKYGRAGDRLWVRETFCIETSVDGEEQPLPHADGRPVKRDAGDESGWSQAHYAATDAKPDLECAHKSHAGDPCPRPWKPSIHMPRWASRIDLEVTKVRVQRLQEITEEDAQAEGVQRGDGKWHSGPDGQYEQDPWGWYAGDVRHNAPSHAFAQLWDSINGSRQGCSWADSPWVWCVSFRRIRP